MTGPMNVALSYLRRAREDDPNTDDGIVSSQATFYDGEVAFVHWRTADALRRAGLVRYGDTDPEWGTSIILAPPAPPSEAEETPDTRQEAERDG